MVSAPGEGVSWYELPEDIILRVPLEHPRYKWFKDLNLQWYALPAVSDMLFEVGGLQFTAAPFNGWYMGTEIGSRDLCDEGRYNITRLIAVKLGLDTSTAANLWKDTAMLEVNVAVLHSFQKNGVTIVDHHTASDSFLTHMKFEQRARGGCPADWVWIVPPMSGSLTGVFHQEMINYNLLPAYLYQERAWVGWKRWPLTAKQRESRGIRKMSLKGFAWAIRLVVYWTARLKAGRPLATILYATETGRSENFAQKLSSKWFSLK